MTFPQNLKCPYSLAHLWAQGDILGSTGDRRDRETGSLMMVYNSEAITANASLHSFVGMN